MVVVLPSGSCPSFIKIESTAHAMMVAIGGWNETSP